MNRYIYGYNRPWLIALIIAAFLFPSIGAELLHHHEDCEEHHDCPVCCFLTQAAHSVIPEAADILTIPEQRLSVILAPAELFRDRSPYKDSHSRAPPGNFLSLS